MENNDYFLSTLHSSIDSIVKNIQLIEQDVRKLVVDKNISLNERWDLFCKFAIECNRAKYYSVYSFENKNFQNYLDDRNFERDVEIDIDWELDNYFEMMEETHSEEQIRRDIIEVKEECLTNFIYSYYNCR